MKSPRLKIILLGFTMLSMLLVISVAGAATWEFFSLGERMDNTLKEKQFLQPTEYFAEGPRFQFRGLIEPSVIEKTFEGLSYRKRQADQILLPGDYFRGDNTSCATRLAAQIPSEVIGCFAFVRKDATTENAPAEQSVILFAADGLILKTAKGPALTDVPELRLEPTRFAQYLGSEPLMREKTALGHIPPACLNAIIAIEDQNFLEHNGYSMTGILRAVFKNVVTGKKGQGGSTITQQLVKNYFLTAEKKYSRKFQELIMSVMLEARFTKDEILQTYLNEIYLGQNGAFRVHGYGSASRYYFGKPVEELNLSECALLAAIVNNPGHYNPWKNAEGAKTRRALVLSKMAEQKMISVEEAEVGKNATLPAKAGQAMATETAPYFIDAVRKQMRANNWPLDGVKIYTSLDLEGQQAAQEAVQNHLGRLETSNKYIKGLKEKGRSLEGMVLSGDPTNGLIHVAVGGRSYRMTQFNRAVDSRRQVGSVMKPFVYLAALGTQRADGTKFTPLTLIKDEKVVLKYEGQTWAPENFEKKFEGDIPLFFALKNSINAATVNLGMEVGLDQIITAAQQMGIESELKKLPSLMLGAFELAPREVLTAAMTLSQFGQRPRLSFIRRVETDEGKVLYEHDGAPAPAGDPVSIGVLVGMMKQTLISGSAKAATLLGFKYPAAGKTGTTNDYRDTWFYGFTPHVATVVWVGFDDNTPTKMTGGSGSVPVWTEFMKKVATRFPPDDFSWPAGTVKRQMSRADLEALHGFHEGDPETTELIFAEGTEP